MSTVGIRDGEFKDLGLEMPAGVSGEAAGAGLPGPGLVLPDEVVADLAGQLVARARAGEPVRLTGAGGLLGGVIGQVLQAGLALELDEHLRRDGGLGGGNGRNGYSAKTLKTEAGPVTVSVPRDRAGTFEPVLVPKGERRTSGISDVVISLYAGGMSVRDIARHLQRTMGIEVSHDTISRITDQVLEEVRSWQSRPLEQVYPVVFVDALMAKVRDGSSVRSKAVNIAVGIDCEGVKHVLGIWVAAAEGCGEGMGSGAGANAEPRCRGRDHLLL
jgi:putative transposase